MIVHENSPIAASKLWPWLVLTFFRGWWPYSLCSTSFVVKLDIVLLIKDYVSCSQHFY